MLAVTLAALLADYLHQQGGFSTSHLSRGDEVLEWVQSHSPDLILLDLMLRKKLTDAGAGKDLVESVYGLGYRYSGPW